MNRPWKTAAFKALKTKWDQKLEESGFKDIEVEGRSERLLKEFSMSIFQRTNRNIEKTQTVMDSAFRYSQLLLEKLASESFEDDCDRLIMERTAEGKTIKEISDELKALLPPGRQRSKHNRDTIRYVRRRYEHKWGIRTWKPQDMVSRKPTRS